MQFQFGRYWRQLSLCGLTLAMGWSVEMPSTFAAEQVTIRLGPFQQSIAIADLEKFAKTGKLPANLQAYESYLTPQIQEVLSKRLQIDPAFADKFTSQMMATPLGRQLFSSLEMAIPGSTTESLQGALSLALRQANGMTALSFLRAYPGENITVDASKAVSLAMEFNPNLLQSQAFGVLLAKDLYVKSDTNFQSSFNPADSGRETVQKQTFTLRDGQRNRTINVDLYSSGGGTQQPLVVISHGFGASRRSFEYLSYHLASHGITVAAIEHPGSNANSVNMALDKGNLSQLLPPGEFIERPRDISFLLNELAKINTQPGQLQGKLNTDRVTVLGHSLGGYTALALVGGEVNLEELRQFCKNSLNMGEAPGDWLQCAAAPLRDRRLNLKDDRVKSAIALNPLVGKLFGNSGLAKINNSVLILSSTEDALTPALKHQIQPFTQLRGSKYLLTAIGATHLSVTDPAYGGGVNTSTIINERRGEETRTLRQLIQGVSLAFIKQQTPEAKIYKQFLTPAYAQSLSTPQLPLRLTSELPENIKKWLDFATSTVRQ
jgi:predicted dienelactone hydrolase